MPQTSLSAVVRQVRKLAAPGDLPAAPDADLHSVGAANFEWIVNAVAELAVKKAAEPPSRTEYRWASMLRG